MKKVSKVLPFRLPAIANPQPTTLSHRLYDSHLESTLDEQNDHSQVQKLDHWTARNNEASRQHKPLQLANSLRYRKESLYWELQPQPRKPKPIELREFALLMEPKVYMLRLEAELKKVHDINYHSMYKNIEYCSGFYQNFYADILRTLDNFISQLTTKCDELESSVKKKRLDHIKSMGSIHSTVHSQILKISQARENIEDKETEVEAIKITIEQLHKAKMSVLRHSLFIGYDVREEGLIWIIRQMGYFPPSQAFPSFLNDKQISFIRKKYQQEVTQKQNQKTLFSDSGKTVDQIVEIVTRKKKRELSMIREGDILRQLKADHSLNYSTERHRYLNEDILQMAEEEFPRTKSTKYEIIYKQTVKKLNKYCVNEIYKKNGQNRKPKEIMVARKESFNTLKILSHFEAKVEDYMRQANNSQALLTEEERELDQIVRNLRYESYQDSSKGERGNRNVISILCCLLGHCKAKSIVEQELNHLS